MKKVTLKSLTLTNFRGEKSRTTELRPDETTIMGGNGLGKSRHFDAFCWLLFGKDALDRKDFEVRSIVNGEPLHKVECSVTGVLDISGEAVTLKRIFAERWVKPRGQVEEVFKGNETETYWNGVPMNVTEYQRRVSDVIPESIFKMVTNPLFFAAQLKWQDQREHLLQMAGAISDGDIAAKSPEFAALLDRITGKSLADFRREISLRKKRLKEDLAQVQPRIDQTQKLMPEASDFEALALTVEALNRQVADIDRAIADRGEAARQQGEARQKAQAEINALKQQRQQALFDAQAKAREAAFAANAERRRVENAIGEAKGKAEALTQSVGRLQSDVSALEKLIEAKKSELPPLREAWERENSKEYAGINACAACGQPLPESMKSEARAHFEQSREATLAKISSEGMALGIRVGELRESINEAEKKLSKTQKELEAEQAGLLRLQDRYAQLPPAGEAEVKPEELPEYVSLSAKISEAESALAGDAPPAAAAELQGRRREAAAQLDAARLELKNKEVIALYAAEISLLEEMGKNLAQQIADAEREEYVAQKLTKARIEECERRINGMFERLSFKLFDYTLEGNEVEVCVPLVGKEKVPFAAANTSGQLNAGLDIINALTKFHGVSAPIFIDRRESVNELIPTESQIINLVVSNDKELIIK